LKQPIANCEEYEVDEDGFVYLRGKKIKRNKLESGYLVVNIKDNRNRWRTKTVGELVLCAFVSTKPSAEFEVRYVNGKPSDCSVKNLRWEVKGKNRIGKREPTAERKKYLDKKKVQRETKQKINEFKALQREMKKMAKELGMD